MTMNETTVHDARAQRAVSIEKITTARAVATALGLSLFTAAHGQFSLGPVFGWLWTSPALGKSLRVGDDLDHPRDEFWAECAEAGVSESELLAWGFDPPWPWRDEDKDAARFQDGVAYVFGAGL